MYLQGTKSKLEKKMKSIESDSESLEFREKESGAYICIVKTGRE